MLKMCWERKRREWHRGTDKGRKGIRGASGGSCAGADGGVERGRDICLGTKRRRKKRRRTRRDERIITA